MDIAMKMTNIDKLATENLDRMREAGHRALRSHQDEPYDYTNFFSVVEDALNVGLPFVRAQVNQVLTTPRAPFNSQVLKMIKGLTASDLENNGGAFQLAAEVNRLLTLFLPTLRVQDIKIVRNGGQLESAAPFQLVVNFFDTRSNMADKVTYDLRLKEQPVPVDGEEMTAARKILLLVKNTGFPVNSEMQRLVNNVSPNSCYESEQAPIREELGRIFRNFLPEYRVSAFQVSDGPIRRLHVHYYSATNAHDVQVVVIPMDSVDEMNDEPGEDREDPQITKVRLILEGEADLRAVLESLSEHCNSIAILKGLRVTLDKIVTTMLPEYVFHGFRITYNGSPISRILNVSLSPMSNLGAIFEVAVQVANMKKQIPNETVTAVEQMTQDEALQELATFGQTHQPETYIAEIGMSGYLRKEDMKRDEGPTGMAHPALRAEDGPDFKSDDPFFFKGKLIRDAIPTEDCDTDVETDPVRVRYFLLRKLFEELGEAQASNFTNAKELGDVIDVVYALGGINDIPSEEIDAAREKKFMERGGFEGGKVWIDPALG